VQKHVYVFVVQLMGQREGGRGEELFYLMTLSVAKIIYIYIYIYASVVLVVAE